MNCKLNGLTCVFLTVRRCDGISNNFYPICHHFNRDKSVYLIVKTEQQYVGGYASSECTLSTELLAQLERGG